MRNEDGRRNRNRLGEVGGRASVCVPESTNLPNLTGYYSANPVQGRFSPTRFVGGVAPVAQLRRSCATGVALQELRSDYHRKTAPWLPLVTIRTYLLR